MKLFQGKQLSLNQLVLSKVAELPRKKYALVRSRRC